MNSLSGKTAIVTGAANGLGAAQAKALVAAGARVVVADVQAGDGKRLADELGEQAVFASLDVVDPQQWQDVIGIAHEQFGPVDILVNNAGIVRRGRIDEHSLADFRAVIEVNLIGTFNGIQAVIPDMKAAGGGSIVNISSIAGIKASPGVPGYVASKWGIRGLTKNAALDLGGYGIRVNSVHPGMHRTPMTAASPHNTDIVALHRTGEPRELADVVIFLAGNQSSFITGAEIVVDGGETAGLAMMPT